MTSLWPDSGALSLDEALGLTGEIGAGFRDYLTELFAEPDLPHPAFALGVMRLGQVMGSDPAVRAGRARAEAAGADAAQLRDLSRWHTSDRFGDLERACLAWVEQFAMDPKGLRDEEAEAVRAHLGDSGLVAFTAAVAVAEALIRMAGVLALVDISP